MLLPPVIRNLLLCEDIRTDPSNPRRVSLIGLLSSIQSYESPRYPLLYREVCVYVQLTECTGVGRFRIQIHHDESDEFLFTTKTYQHDFGTDPLEIHGMSFRIVNCRFPKPGLYVFEFCYNDSTEAVGFLVMR